MTSSVMSLLAPRGRSFTSSTTPLVFISEWRSYLGRPPASCEGFCAGAMVTHNIKNKANRNGVLVAGERKMGFFRLSSTGPPSGRPRARYEGRTAFRRARPDETETQKHRNNDQRFSGLPKKLLFAIKPSIASSTRKTTGWYTQLAFEATAFRHFRQRRGRLQGGVQGWQRYQSPLGETYGSGCAEG